MAIPTFNGESLFSRAAADMPGKIDVRVRTETMPGVDGEFVQPHGTGARQITATGWLEGAGATPAVAHQALKAAVRTKQALADGQTVATYVGTDGHSYQKCLLVSYELQAGVRTSAGGGSYRAIVPVEVVLRQVVP